MKINDGYWNVTTSVLDWDRDLRSLCYLGFTLHRIHEGHVKGLGTLTIPKASEWKHSPEHMEHCHRCGEKAYLGKNRVCPTCKSFQGGDRYKYEAFADGEYRLVCPQCRQALIDIGWRSYVS